MHREYCTISVPQSHYEPTQDGCGQRLVHDEPTQERVVVEIDIEAIAREYGPRACRSKSRRSRQLRGLVVLKCK